jgi:DNA-binding MarR family transcriptional regulator
MKDRAHGGPKPLAGVDLDKVIHERSRLMVLTYLASSERGAAGFTELRDGLGFTAGNLSVQIKTLEEAGYVSVDKRFVANKSYTGVSLTSEGHRALSSYLAEMETIIASLKAGPRAPAMAETGGANVDSAADQVDQDLS